MCLIITAFAAVITTIVWYFRESSRKYLLGRLVLMYWGAALMWCVDGVFSVAEGGSFFNLSTNDALLGGVVVFCGVVAWIIMLFIYNLKNTIKKAD